MEALLNFSPVVVVALKFGAGSLGFEPAGMPTAMSTNPQRSTPRKIMDRVIMGEMYHNVTQPHKTFETQRKQRRF
jgi:hypothetical protein